MHDWIPLGSTVLASFMASLVEFVEALTIVLAVGLVRGWRSALLGASAALVLLAVIVLCLGPSLSRIPLALVQVLVGTLLLLFGLRWLRKAILRAAGVLALHDETMAFASETESMSRHARAHDAPIDKIAFAASFKIVMLEGIEVVFIVIAIGAGGPLIGAASAGALAALLVVVVLGMLLHRPLAQVPENTLKFGVGILLSAFGTFWVAEGLGWSSPLGEFAILALMLWFLVASFFIVPVCKTRFQRAPKRTSPAPRSEKQVRSAIANALTTMWGLFVDDGLMAIAILAWVGLAWLSDLYPPSAGMLRYGVFAAGLACLMMLSASKRAGQSRSP